MTNITALTVPQTGDGSVLTLSEVDLPDPGPGQVQVEVAAAGVNFIDVYQRQGIYSVPTPFTLGMEGAGTVVAAGEGTHAHVGDRVAWAMQLGSAATRVNLPQESVVPVPDGLELEVAAAAMLQGMTAHFLVNSTYVVHPGQSALVHAAAGGVGQLLVQMIAAKGGRAIATAGSPEKLEIAKSLGAHAVIDYSATADLPAAVRAANDGQGVHVAYDGVGKATFDASLASLRQRGLLVLFGGASGQVPPFDLQRLNSGGSLYVTRPTLAHHVADRDELLWRSGEVLGALARGDLTLSIGGRWPLAEAAQAYEALEGRASTGKLLLLP